MPQAPTFLSYYRRAERSRHAVESLTGKTWDRVPDFQTFETDLQSATVKALWLDMFLAKNEHLYSYLIYLRHHGFPSPPLDWSESPFVAATFAFDAADAKASRVGVYVWYQDTLQSFGSDGHAFVVGPYIRTHPRHYLQQSRYSLAVLLHTTKQGEAIYYDYGFANYHELLERPTCHDLFALIRIPRDEYGPALVGLDRMNLNPHSLLGTEDSLRRELLFR